MKRFAYIFCKIALVTLLIAGVGLVWRNKRQHENDKALLAAIKAGDTPAAIAALKRGANPNARDKDDTAHSDEVHPNDHIQYPGPRSEEDEPALYIAVSASCNAALYKQTLQDCKAPNLAIIKALLDAGANPNAVMLDARLPLIIAETQREYGVAHLLLEHHADIHAGHEGNETALMIAAENDDCAEIEYLLQHGANIEEGNRHGKNALYWAVDVGAHSAVKYLVEHGANVYHTDDCGNNALHFARKSTDPTDANLLVRAGAID